MSLLARPLQVFCTFSVALCAALLGGLVAAPPASGTTATARSVALSLTLQAESGSATYERSAFRHWIDADGDSCNTRSEVLQEESLATVTYGTGCTVSTGEWFSPYDGATWTAASDVDIDHVVALKESWESGAEHWTAERRKAFANDLDYAPSLLAVTDNVNASKGASDPAQWLPPLEAARCQYATDWVTVKYRWRLAVDAAELDALLAVLDGACGEQAVSLPTQP